eukprot:3657005-Pyramimonas_sp.AAC.1
MGQAQIAQATAQLTATANSLIAHQQQVFTAQVHEFLTTSKQKAAHLDLHDKSTHELHSRAGKVEADQQRMRRQLQAMEQTLAVAEASVPFDGQRIAEWDRAPDPTVFSTGAPRAMAPAAIKTALSE